MSIRWICDISRMRQRSSSRAWRCRPPIATRCGSQLGRDTDLLFHHGRYGGWILGSPIAHLVSEPGEAASGTDDPRLHEPLREYLALVVEPNIARMGDEDPDLHAALDGLRARLRAIDGGPARALESSIECVLDTFYPG
jgi:hypothetical protein